MTGGRAGGAAPAQARAIQNRFENWRKNKSGRERIPEPLWKAAVKLCQRHGIDRVRRWLRLNYTGLRDRVGGAQRSGPVLQSSRPPLRGGRTPRLKKKSGPAFVEWVSRGTTSASSGAEYVLEVQDARGGPSVRLRVRGAAVTEVAELTRLLGRSQP